MPRQSSGNFNQKEYIKEWKRQHMKSIKFTYNTDFINSFKDACKTLGISQSSVIKQTMTETIEKALKK